MGVENVIVHLFELEDLISEIELARESGAAPVIRLERIVISEPMATAGMARRRVGLAARCVVWREVFSFWLELGSVDMLHGRPWGPGAEAIADGLEALGRRWESELARYLFARELTVRPGLIDLGGIRPSAGDWADRKAEIEAERSALLAEVK